MADLLVKLYTPRTAVAQPDGVDLRPPIGPEHGAVQAWVQARFGPGWASEVGAALGNRPVSCWLALQGAQLLGFACFDATARGYFGPIGVDTAARGRGIGRALLQVVLDDMQRTGYGYAIIGGVGSDAQLRFYREAAGAVPIEGSTPGLYGGMLRG
jgi:ribosomal protein S18 acetylase RimI-like enzyme